MSRKKHGTTEWQWSEMAYRIDPELSAPERVYVFDNGNRVFYQPRKRINTRHGNRKKS